jgi:SpoVK/Ycf46/Vps4 family AAA+-type ATPase
VSHANLLCELIQYGLSYDIVNLRKTAEAICADEKAKQHWVLANRIEKILREYFSIPVKDLPVATATIRNRPENLVIEKLPERKLNSIQLPMSVVNTCNDLIEEHIRADLLRAHGVEPRNKILLIGPPGNGKTSLAEAIAETLIVPLLIVRYESIVGLNLGETAFQLNKLFSYARTRQCALFFDDFETLGKERGDIHETGELKRIVSSLLFQIDALPSYVVVIAATNHESLLDIAAWCRFQIKLTLPMPNEDELLLWLHKFEKSANIKFGIDLKTITKKLVGKSYAETEEFALSVYRKHILQTPDGNMKDITLNQLQLLAAQANNQNNKYIKDIKDIKDIG